MATPPPSASGIAGHYHAVRFYENKASLCRTVGDFLAAGFSLGQPGLVIATPSHIEAIVSELQSREIAVHDVCARGDLLLLDAREVLRTFMVDGQPDAAAFQMHVSTAIDRVCRGRKNCTVRAYGEMVDVLWQDGSSGAAIKLELLWNQLALTREFSLLCGYAIGSFYKSTGMREVCQQHSHVLAAESALIEHPPDSIN